MTRDSGKPARDIRHPVPTCPCKIARAADHSVEIRRVPGLLLVRVIYQDSHRVLPVTGHKVSDIETGAQHMSADILGAGCRAGNLMPVEIEIGEPVGVVEMEPYPVSLTVGCRKVKRHPVPERSVVESLVHAVDIVPVVGIFLYSCLHICSKDSAGHYTPDILTHIKTGHGYLLSGEFLQVIIWSYLPFHTGSSAVKRNALPVIVSVAAGQKQGSGSCSSKISGHNKSVYSIPQAWFSLSPMNSSKVPPATMSS